MNFAMATYHRFERNGEIPLGRWGKSWLSQFRKTKMRQPTGQTFFPTWKNAKKSGIMKSGLDAMPLFLLDDLLKQKRFQKIVAWIRSHHLQWKFKIQIIVWKVYLRSTHSWVMSTTFCFQKFVDNSQQCFVFTLQAKVEGSNPGYLLKSFLL